MEKNALKIQNAFHRDITTYVNGAVFSRIDIFYSILVPIIPFIKYSRSIKKNYYHFLGRLPKGTNEYKKIIIKPYKGKNIYVHKMIKYLEENLWNDLIGAYVHGSLGSNEEIPYSDFDALIILNDKVFEKPEQIFRVAYKLNKARLFMYEFDPLQHHGWFLLTQADLDFYPEYYFPIQLLKFAKSLFSNKGLVLKIQSYNSSELSRCQFIKLSDSIIMQVEGKDYPKNIYQLKSLLSRFMLLPSLYFQIRSNRAIYKKFSFEEVKKDFTPKEWKIMDIVTAIRTNWDYKISPHKKWIMSKPNYIGRFFAKRNSPKIPYKISKNLSPQFYLEMKKLAVLMKDRLNRN